MNPKVNVAARLKRCLPALVIALLSAVVIACSGVTGDSSEFRQLPEEGWKYGDTLRFTDSSNDSLATNRRIKLAIRHDNEYPYSNLWLEASYVDAEGRQHRDTVEMQLADVYGHWLGMGIGSSYQQEATVNPSVNLPPKSDVNIRHIMRVDTLCGLQQVGVTIVKND